MSADEIRRHVWGSAVHHRMPLTGPRVLDRNSYIDKALTRATKKAGKAIDKGDVSAALEDLEKGLDKSVNIAGE